MRGEQGSEGRGDKLDYSRGDRWYNGWLNQEFKDIYRKKTLGTVHWINLVNYLLIFS